MNTQEELLEKPADLEHVLSKKFEKTIRHADYEIRQLHGGTLGNVRLVSGTAEDADGNRLPYQIVWKIQKKWERHGDPHSWRREYDLYLSDLGDLFTESFRWPICYHAELHDDRMELWMEYIDGVSGLKLTPDMYVRAAEELGRFQGKLYATQSEDMPKLANVSQVEFLKNFYLHYRSWPEVYDYIRSEDCELPRHLCTMLIDLDTHSDDIFKRIAKLPVVLCHRDFWVANLICSDDQIRIIDWDTAGWGYMGEDLASLIADEADVPHMVEYYQRCVPAYYKGFAENADVSHITDPCVYELILMMFGYRLIEWYKFAESPEQKTLHLDTLQKIYEMKSVG
jgi:hypothetical protein